MKKKTLVGWSLLLLLAACHACRPEAEAGMRPGERENEMDKIEISSSAFEEGGAIPRRHTCDGEDVSLSLSWSRLPQDTRSLVLICDDPDASVGTWVHSVLYGLSPDVTALPEGVPSDEDGLAGARQGTNDFRRIGYGGPCPPRGSTHRYFFRLYAVDSVPEIPSGARAKDVLKAIEGRVLAEGQLVGRCKR